MIYLLLCMILLQNKIFWSSLFFAFFTYTDTPPPGIYTLSLHDALPIWERRFGGAQAHRKHARPEILHVGALTRDFVQGCSRAIQQAGRRQRELAALRLRQ